MARKIVEIPYHSGRGAAKSKAEQYLLSKGYKRQTSKRGGYYFILKPGSSTIYQCVQMDFDDDKFTLSAWITGVTPDSRHVKIGEEDLTGLRRFASKQQLRKTIKNMQKLFEVK